MSGDTADDRPITGEPRGPWANPIATNPFASRADMERAVVDLYEPLLPFVVDDARIRLGSFGAAFERASGELEGFARPLYGIVPLVAGGGRFEHWDLVRAGLIAGTDPDHPGYWGAVVRDIDQRMVEQAAIGIALAFCPDEVWEPLTDEQRDRLVDWLGGIAEFEPAPNNWQFFRVLVALGLERVGRPLDADAVERSLELLEGYRLGEHWYVDGGLQNVDYYVPMAFHTYGLIYAAANDLGLGDDDRAARYRERARAFAADFATWFGPDGAAVAMGRSLIYRFALGSFWGALAWADVEPAMGWGAVKGMLLRHLRWWTDKAISDRDGVLSVGYAYDNRTLRESYNSAGSPYWCMKAFTALGASESHPVWAADEADHPVNGERVLHDAGWLARTDDQQTIALLARPAAALALPEQASAKYRKLAYSSRFGLVGDVPDFLGRIVTDSTLAIVDRNGVRHVRLGVDQAEIRVVTLDDGSEQAVAWSVWSPCPDVVVRTTCWFVDGSPWHLRAHRIRTDRPVSTLDTGFALGCDAPAVPDRAQLPAADGIAAVRTWDGDSRIADLSGSRSATVHAPGVDAGLLYPNTIVPGLAADLAAGTHLLVAAIAAGDHAPAADPPEPSAAVLALLD
ncbi:MAG: DUF2264 domain-containing protein [Ilumatobacter fluminis]|uniref:DUF2264 domain-containing protein n=1 Tax=Ilumatobacter fluminis TaxID=467091 RepID=UPI0032EF280D